MFASRNVRSALRTFLILLVAACANPTVAVPGRSPTSTPILSPTQSPGAYTIGVLASITGPYAGRGIATRDGVQLAADELNTNGGIGGRTVNVLVEDDQSDPARGVIALKNILNQNAVAAIGPESSAVAAALLPIQDESMLPVVSLADAASPAGSVPRSVFMIAPPPNLVAGAVLSYLQKSNLHHLAVLHESTPLGSAGVASLQQQGSRFRVEVLADETYQLTETDFTRQLTNVKNNPAVDSLLVWGSSGTATAAATKQVRDLGVGLPLLLTVAQADPGYLQEAGTAANGAILQANRPLIARFLLPDDPAYQPVTHFVAAYKRATGNDPNLFAALGYDAFNALIAAISSAGADPGPLVAQLEKSTFTGVAGPYAFSASDHTGMQPSAFVMVAVRNGAFVPIKPNCDGCAPTTLTQEEQPRSS